MDFQLTDEQRMMKETVYKWAVKELGPIQEKIDEEDWFPPDFSRSAPKSEFLESPLQKSTGDSMGISSCRPWRWKK